MNYWKQFAEILGLELGQEFELTYADGNRKDGYAYKITKIGILYKSQINDDWYGERSDTIERLLEGYDKAVPNPWKPKKGDIYWHYSGVSKEENAAKWGGKFIDLLLWKCGDCFKTAEEARTKGKEIMEQIKKEYEEA
mgnify:CR=1 FL=1